MDIVIVSHTEFGYVRNKSVVYDKNFDRKLKGVSNLVQLANKYNAKITFGIMPEVAKSFPKNLDHELGLHIHPGWQVFNENNLEFCVGDKYLWDHCEQSSNSTVLRDHSYKDQLNMIKAGSDLLYDIFGSVPSTFVAGRWSVNNDTIRALVRTGFKQDCSAPPNSKSKHFDWSQLQRICMPYHPSKENYQEKGNLPLLMIPISQMFPTGIVTPEFAPTYGLSWMKACFLEYYRQNVPLFHICLHSPCMTDSYFISIMDNFLKFIHSHENVNFKSVSEIKEYKEICPTTDLKPYILGINKHILNKGFKFALNSIKLKLKN